METSRYKSYIFAANNEIIEILSSSLYSIEEKRHIIEELAEELESKVVRPEAIQDYNYLIAKSSLIYLDKQITKIIYDNESSINEYENGINLCRRAKERIQQFKDNKWILPVLSHPDIESCENTLIKLADARRLQEEIIQIDATLKEKISTVKQTGELSDCEACQKLLNDLDVKLKVAREKNVFIPDSITNIHSTSEFLLAKSEEIKQHNSIKQSLIERDKSLSKMIHASNSDETQWIHIIDLCKEQQRALSGTVPKNIPINLLYPNPQKLIPQYELYISLKKRDEQITELLSTSPVDQANDAQLVSLKGLCTEQSIQMDECKKNRWTFPALQNLNISGILELIQNNIEKNIRKRRRRKKLALGILVVILVAAIATGAFLYQEKQNRLIEFTNNSDQYIGQYFDAVAGSLRTDGFLNIEMVPVESGWNEGKTVLSVTLGNGKTFKKGDKTKANSKIYIKYSSDNRIKLSSLLKDWESADYEVLQDVLSSKGFHNIKIKEKATTRSEINHLVSSISIDGDLYKDQTCYVPKTASIVLEYYVYVITVGKSSNAHTWENWVYKYIDPGVTDIHQK